MKDIFCQFFNLQNNRGACKGLGIFTLTLFTTWVLVSGFASARSPSPIKGPPDLYFLAVGNSSYADKDFESFDVPRWSAELVAKSLQDAGAKYGILLTSPTEGKQYVTRKDVYKALADLKQKIRDDGSKTARIFVYISMHGLADRKSHYLYMVPGNLQVDKTPMSQQYVFRLAKRSVWSVDLLTALMNFRRDPRLTHFDKFVYSSLLSNKLGLSGNLEQFHNVSRFNNYLDQKRSTYGTVPFDNAPIPFVLMIDNCVGGVGTDLVQSNVLMKVFVNQVYNATLDAGRAYYAVEPGSEINPKVLPKLLSPDKRNHVKSNGREVLPIVGPLAIHLVNVLQNRKKRAALTLGDFDDAFSSSRIKGDNKVSIDPPYSVQERLREDVSRVDFIPRKGFAKGTVEKRLGSGGIVHNCCISLR